MKELHEALLKVQQELKTIKTDAKGNFGNYASLEQVLDSVEPTLHKHGLLLLQLGTAGEAQNFLTTSVIHVETGQEINSTFMLTPDKPGPQGFGAATTYFRRYSILALLGKATGEDPDSHVSAAPKSSSHTSAASKLHSSLEGIVEGEGPEQILNKLIPVMKNKYGGKYYREVPLDDLLGSVRWMKSNIKNLNKWQEEFLRDVEMLKFANSDFAPEEHPPF
jgi:hypothetical protein